MYMDIFNGLWSIIKTIQFRDIVDILAIALIMYGLFRLIRETRAAQLLKGIMLLLAIYILSSIFHLMMLSTLLRAFFGASVVIITVIFQPEIRKALEQVGKNKNWRKYLKVFSKESKSDEWEKSVRKSIVDAADTAMLFSRSRTGALMVFEREIMLSDFASTGTIVDAETSVALFGNIFFNKAPLHDGACIIRDGKLFAAGCILPLTTDKNVDSNLGTRHRAALGISEQSDAAVLVVSEETGVISLAVGGELIRELNRDKLVNKLNELLLDEVEEEESKYRVFRKGRKK